MADYDARWRRNVSCAGFTLVEMLLVLLILTVVAGLTAPNLSRSLTQHQFQKSADELLNMMRYAQSRAITKGHAVRLVFNEDYQEYWLTEASANPEASDQAFERVPGRMGAPRLIPDDVTVESDEDLSELTFYPDGRMDRRELGVCKNSRCKMISTRIQRGFIRSFDGEETI